MINLEVYYGMNINETNPAAAVKYIVVSGEWHLRNTVWTSQRTRATEFETHAAAAQALAIAKKFMKSSAYKSAQVVVVA